jgi:hypothetical protein
VLGPFGDADTVIPTTGAFDGIWTGSAYRTGL